jgi:hypothetical protein
MKTSNYLILALLSLIVFSCKKQQEDTIQQTTQQISKIETFYNGIEPKDESKYIDNLPVSSLSEKELELYMAGIRERSELEKPTYELKSSSGSVGVIKSGSCSSYTTFTVYLDNQDYQTLAYPNLWTNYWGAEGWTGDCSINQNNVTLKFCLVSDQFSTVDGRYAVLRTSVHPSLHYLDKYFDCEDNNNASWCQLGSTTYNNNFNNWGSGSTAVTKMNGGNFEMYCDYYDSSLNPPSGFGFPNLGIAYGVFGTLNTGSPMLNSKGKIVTLEETNRNAGWCHMDIPNRSNGVEDVIYWGGGTNNQTTLCFTKVKEF